MSITIAIPFYNVEKYLIDAIRSVFAQTYQDWELILIDDGSTDNSLKIAKSIKDPRVRVISDGKNKKLAARLNQVTTLAKFDYIARMDADDLMFPNRLEEQLKCFKENLDIDIVTTGVYSVLNNLTIRGIRGQDFEYPKFTDILSRRTGITHAALIAKKSWYQRNKYDEKLSIAQDLDLWIRSSKKNDLKVKSISNPLYIYREEDNVKINKILNAYKNERWMIKKYSENNSLKLILKSYLKSMVVYGLGFVGKIHLLQEKRGDRNIPENQKENFEQAIQEINNTKIPGID
jgi:glycosyltransferase involved in cell wall biosynthesis